VPKSVIQSEMKPNKVVQRS